MYSKSIICEYKQ